MWGFTQEERVAKLPPSQVIFVGSAALFLFFSGLTVKLVALSFGCCKPQTVISLNEHDGQGHG